METLYARPLLTRRDDDDDDHNEEKSHEAVVVTGPILKSDVSLSFWGGIDPRTGVVIDQQHPLVGQCVANTILCLPSGRGSCTASQVYLELLLNNNGLMAPKAIVLRDPDALLAVGAVVAQEVFGISTTIVCVGRDGFAQLMYTSATYAAVHVPSSSKTSQVILGTNKDSVLKHAQVQASKSKPPPRVVPAETRQQYTEYEQGLLTKASTEAERMALRVIFQYARICLMATTTTANTTDNDNNHQHPIYTAVTKAHIDGCTYIGPGGLAFVQRLVEQGGRVSIPTTLNSVSTDRRRWQALGVPETYAKNAIALGDAYLELGCQPSFTCAPYLLANSTPTLGEDLVWGESNAVVYANSVLGARTEKYADYLDICAALVGLVPRVGVHVDENRQPRIVLDAKALFATELSELLNDTNNGSVDIDALFPVLGHLCGSLSDGKVPILIGLEAWSDMITTDNLKAFCAAYGTTGTSPLIHISGITPEAKDAAVVAEWTAACGESARAMVTLQGLEDTHALLDKGPSESSSEATPTNEVDLIALGNPHLSTTECGQLASIVREVGGRKRDNVRLIGCISREIYALADQQGHIEPLREFGMEFISDTCWCMLLDPPVIPANPNGATLTNSGKYAHYGRGLTNRKFRFAGTRDCIEVAATGSYAAPRHSTKPAAAVPSWLSRSPTGLQTRSLSTMFRKLPRGFPL